MLLMCNPAIRRLPAAQDVVGDYVQRLFYIYFEGRLRGTGCSIRNGVFNYFFTVSNNAVRSKENPGKTEEITVSP